MTKHIKSSRDESFVRDAAVHPVSRVPELEYIADMLPQLRKMALGIDEGTLAYLLEVAMLEAQLVLDIERQLTMPRKVSNGAR